MPQRFLFVLLFSFLCTILHVSTPSTPSFARSSDYAWKVFKHEGQILRVRFNGKAVLIQVKPKRGDSSYNLSKRYLSDWKNQYRRLEKKYNRGKSLKAGVWLTMPFDVFNGEVQGAALRKLFPKDEVQENGWVHHVTYKGEHLTLITALFAKAGIASRHIAKSNNLRSRGRKIILGQEIVIPWKWIREDLDLKPQGVKKPLYIKKDRSGKRYAYYKLKKGEAIYSAVVVRFTGRMMAEEVTRLAKSLLKLNGIRDAKKISPGTELKIPLEWISDEYLEGKEAPKKKRRAAKKTTPVVAKKQQRPKKQKIHVILDAGHGGVDPGAMAGSRRRGDLAHEDDVVYDIMLRAKKLLEDKGYVVHPTIKDHSHKHPVSKLGPRKDQDEYLLVTPRYNMQSSKHSVNLRVYLVNDLYHDLVYKKKVPKDNIIFVSIHADALHSSIRGAMVYYPHAKLRSKEFRLRNRIYQRRDEYTSKIRFSYKDNRYAAEVSEDFGHTLIDAFEDIGLRTHGSKSVRGFHYRRGRKTLPAVLRYSKVPTSVLLEVANLNNRYDRSNLLNSRIRQKMARALSNAITNHFYANGALNNVAKR